MKFSELQQLCKRYSEKCGRACSIDLVYWCFLNVEGHEKTTYNFFKAGCPEDGGVFKTSQELKNHILKLLNPKPDEDIELEE